MAKWVKERAQLLIRVFVDASLSSDKDAGWHQGSMLQQLIDHKGELPLYTGRGSGYEDKMLREISFVRGAHPLLNEAKDLFRQLPNHQRLCLYMYERYGKVPKPGADGVFTEREIAAMVGLTQASFHNHRTRGMAKLCQLIESNRAADLDELTA